MSRFNIAGPNGFFNELDSNFSNFFATELNQKREWKPTSRIEEEKSHFHLSLDIPGVDKEHLKVDLKDNVISISGERSDLLNKDNSEYRSVGSFSQKYSLPKNANLDEIEVSQVNGVLDIVIPKINKEKESKTLDIKTGKNGLLS
jgi:HSP20 family protein